MENPIGRTRKGCIESGENGIAQARSFCAAIKIVCPVVPVSQYPVLKQDVEAEIM